MPGQAATSTACRLRRLETDDWRVVALLYVSTQSSETDNRIISYNHLIHVCYMYDVVLH